MTGTWEGSLDPTVRVWNLWWESGAHRRSLEPRTEFGTQDESLESRVGAWNPTWDSGLRADFGILSRILKEYLSYFLGCAVDVGPGMHRSLVFNTYLQWN